MTVGKSCVLARFVDDKFKQESTHTIGVEFGSKILVRFKRNVLPIRPHSAANQKRGVFLHYRKLEANKSNYKSGIQLVKNDFDL